MNGIAGSTAAPVSSQPRLRLVREADARRSKPSRLERERAAMRSAACEEPGDVLVAGADASTRARMLLELRNLLPESTHFAEARETWELLARATGSRMVVLTDDLGDISTDSLVRLLGRRHPALPVLAVGDRPRSSAPLDVDAASV